MASSIYTKKGKIQFWGLSLTPDWMGAAFSPDCCPCPCWFYFDDFNDPDTTTPANWYEILPSDWGILGYTFVEDYSTGVDGTPNAIAICTVEQPAAHAGEQYVGVILYTEYVSTGDKYYLYPCCLDIDTIGPVTIEYECTDSPSYWTVRTGSGDDLIEQDFLILPNSLDQIMLVACVDTTVSQVKAWVNYGVGQEPLWDDDLDPGSGRYSGIGHDNDEHLNVFDDYYVGELRREDGVDCNDCFCRCQDYALHKKLHLAIYNGTGRADCMDGKGCDLDWEWVSATGRWTGTVSGPNHDPPAGNGLTWERTFHLICTSADPEHPGQNFTLIAENPHACCTADNCESATPSSATCYPSFFLVFGPFYMSWDDLACVNCYYPSLSPPPEGGNPPTGEYYVIITPHTP